MKKGIKYGILLPGWFFLTILILLLLAGLIIQTGPAKRKIAAFAETRTSEFINGNLTIGKIDGNFFSRLSLKNVAVTMGTDTVASIKEIKASYNLRGLLRKKIVVSSAQIIEPRIFLRQENDSTWNVQRLIQPGPETADTTNSGSFVLDIPEFRIEKGNIITAAIDSIIPREVQNLNTELSFFWSDDVQEAHLKQFSLNTRQPDLKLNRLEFLLKREKNFIELKDFRLQTAQNQLRGTAGFEPDPGKTGSATIETSAIEPEEFSYFLPHIKFRAKPVIKSDIHLEQNSLRGTVELADNGQHILLHFTSDNLADYLFNQTKTELSYAFDAEFENVELVHWLGNPELDYVINGNLEAAGQGIDPETARVKLAGRLNNWIIQNKQLNEVLFEMNIANENLDGFVKGNGEFGRFNLNHKIQGFMKNPIYRFELTTRELDLQRLTGIKNLRSDINMSAQVSGTGFTPEKMAAAAEITITGSRLQHISFDTVQATANYRNENIQVDSLRMKTRSATLTAKGNYSLKSVSDMLLSVEFSGLEEFSAYLPENNLQTSGKVNARLWGIPDSLHLESLVELNKTEYNELSFDSLNLKANGLLTPADSLINAQMVAFGLSSGNLFVDSLTANIEGNSDSLFFVTNVTSADLNTGLHAGIIPGEKLKIVLDEWEIDYKNQHWALQQPPAIFEIDSLDYSVTNFILASGASDSSQYIQAGGKISLYGEEDFLLEIKRADISKLSELFEMEHQPSGLLNAQLALKGSASSPEITGEFSLNKAAFNEYRFTEFGGKLNYHDSLLSIETLVIPQDSGRFKMTTSLPLHLKTDTMNFELNPLDSVKGQVVIENFSLAIFQSINPSVPVSGYLEGKMDVSGTVESPLVNGNFSLNEAAFNEYRFTDAGGKLEYRNNLLSFETLIVPADSGRIQATGSIPLVFNPDTLNFGFNPKDSVHGQVILEKFSLGILQSLNPNSSIAGYLDGKVDISGTAEAPIPAGNIRLRNASVEMREYGIAYDNIRLNLNFLRDKIALDSFLIRSKDGNITGNGQIDFASDFYRGEVSQSQINLKLNKFRPFDHRQFNMQVSGDINLGGKKGEVVYGGSITIPRAEIYLPAIFSMMGKMNVQEMPKPILVQEAENMSLPLDSLGIKKFVTVKPDSVQFDYLDQFKGKLSIKIPRNTWIKNEDMYIELSGDLELIKNNEYFELFGAVDVVRGQYDLLGKTFVIDEGSISFQGGEEMSPVMDIKASYTFRNPQRVEQALSVHIQGTAESPEVDFQLDGSSISEGDALSYILFGKGMNELTMDEQENVAGAGGGTLAGKAAASILSSQITSFLGDKLAVDYIEVKSDGSFDNATVVVGKYITNDLFVSYEQRFGETNEKNIAKYEVKLEYELFRFLFFELNNSSNDSGFDVIMKFDAE